MTFARVKIFVLFAAALVALSAVASAAASPVSCKPGGLSKAVDVAYQDFYSFLRPYSNASGGGLAAFLGKIDSYEVRAVADGDNYIVKFVPFGYSGGVVKGGGAKYTISKCTLRIDDIKGKQPIG